MIAKTLLAAASALSFVLAPAGGSAGERTASSRDVSGVVELFTSQGCASCPPADGVMAALAGDPRLVALAYHVDYWDYIGWKDTHGSRDNTERQKAYAETLKSGSIYTPQAVINGREDVSGAEEPAIRRAVRDTAIDRDGGRPEVTLALKGKRLHIAVDGGVPPDSARSPVLMLVTFDRWSEAAVDRGENEGKTLVSTNAVRSWRILGMWEGKPLGIDIPLAMLDENDKPVGSAAILQEVTPDGGPGPILAAAILPR
ncbi:hypothetical protein GCM10011390_14100 [Aureimonas endophytica]|uniref:DUF1223 domain-containing protein n=1 Tax=Aureimonas endophytica TaxID=2027858 RepID=A0A916ZGB8_9HYPH|nr:DUF1223 domain-containing protein [Aureimonas endophytica]GGD96472.1 hypothetical protein GCM10011390_14100 [Aureimonas endophytica]